jgi:transposase-like protein
VGKPVPLDELTRLYLDERLSVADIASRLGLTPQRVYERFRENGISLRRRLSKEELTDLYQNQKLTIREIAKQAGYSVFTVRKYLDQYEIPRPNRRESASPVPLDELTRLYLEERLSVKEIATRVGGAPNRCLRTAAK